MPRQREAMKDVVSCDKLRGAAKQALIRRFPNGETQLEVMLQYRMTEYIGHTRRTGGTETSKYPQEKKTIEIPSVAASERGRAQTCTTSVVRGLWGQLGISREVTKFMYSRAVWKVRP